MELNDMKYIIGFKGFDSNFRCRKMQFEIGKTYLHEDKLKICSSGFHFCQNLKDVFPFYNCSNSNKFALVKAKYYSGTKYNQHDKSVTDYLEVLEEIPFELVSDFKKSLNKRKERNKDVIFGLDKYKILQKTYPDLILGGSSALYLQGFNINRDTECGDLDLIVDKYTLLDINKFNPNDHVTEVDTMDDDKCSGNDFDYTSGIVINGDFVLLDFKIDNKAKYSIIDYKGFKYKVCPWKVIIEAKLRYSINSQKKHTDDLINMFQIKSLSQEIEKIELNPIQELMKKYETIS